MTKIHDNMFFLILIIALLFFGGCSYAGAVGNTNTAASTAQQELAISAEDHLPVVDLSAYSGSVLIDQGGVYQLTGTLSEGQLLIEVSKDDTVELILSNVSITSASGAAINCRQAKKLIITLADGTENSLTDTAKYTFDDPAEEEPDAALFSKADTIIRGNGALTVNGNYKHGIASKDDLEIENGTICVTSVSDALRGKDCVTIKGGSFQIRAGKDGISSTNIKDAEKGAIAISGGNFDITAAGDAIQAETVVSISGGEFAITTEGRSTGTSDSQKGIKAKEMIVIDSGTFELHTTDDAIHSNLDLTVNGGEFRIETEDDGIHADRALQINGGTFNIPRCYEGFEGTEITFNGGNVFINATDDAIGAYAGTESAEAFKGWDGNPNISVTINGGEIEAVSGGDTVDSNGNIFVNGGKLRLSSPADPYYEGVLLCNGRVTVTGGDLAMVGNIGVELTVENQPMVLVSFSTLQPSGTTVSLRDREGNILLETLSRRDYKQAIFSSGDLRIGETYAIYAGEQKIVELTLQGMINKVSNDGGPFTGGYPRGHW